MTASRALRRIASVAFSAGAAFAAEPAAAPVAYDFGVQLPGAVVEHRFSFANRGDSAWTVAAPSASCTCTVVDPLPDRVEPGGDLPIPVRVSVGQRRDVRVGGDVTVVVTDGAGPRTLTCSFTAQVGTPLVLPRGGRLAPVAIAIGEQPRTWQERLRKGTYPAAWDRLEARVASGGGELRVAPSPAADGSGDWLLDFSLSAGDSAGVVPVRIELACSGGGVPLPFVDRLLVPVRIDGPVHAEPASLLFAALPPGRQDEGRIVVADRAGTPQAVTAAVASDPGRCTVEVRPEGELLIRFRAAEPAGPASAWVDITTAAGRVRVPYAAAVSAADGGR